MVFRLFKEFANITYSLPSPSSIQSLAWNNGGNVRRFWAQEGHPSKLFNC